MAPIDSTNPTHSSPNPDFTREYDAERLVARLAALLDLDTDLDDRAEAWCRNSLTANGLSFCCIHVLEDQITRLIGAAGELPGFNGPPPGHDTSVKDALSGRCVIDAYSPRSDHEPGAMRGNPRHVLYVPVIHLGRTLALISAVTAGRVAELQSELQATARVLEIALTHCGQTSVPANYVTEIIRQMEDCRRSLTELRRNEDRYRQIIDTAMDAVITMDDSGNITSWNAQAVIMFGLSRREAIGSSVTRLIPVGFRERHQEGLARLREEGIGPILGRCVEFSALRADGKEFPIELTINRIYSEGPVSYTAFIRDITMRRDAEVRLSTLHNELEHRVDERTRELRQAIKELNAEIKERRQVERNLTESRARISEQASALELALTAANQASQMKSEFVARMSHEIRTPLNAVLGMTGLLIDTDLSEHQRRLAFDVRTAAEALLLLLNDILDFSKIEAGKLTIETVPFDLRRAVTEVSEMLAARADARGIKLIVEISSSVPSQLRGDPGRLRQVITNLADNALKFTRHGSVTIRVDLVDIVDGDAAVRVSVVDSGIGISPDKLTRIFDEFTQADASTTREYGGTGLGLAICKQIIELMDGEIGVESTVGAGSTFWFKLCLPIVDADVVSAIPAVELSRIRVLLADADETHATAVTASMKDWGIFCDRATSAKDARAELTAAAAAGNAYQIALIGHTLSDMTGTELADMLHSDPEHELTLLVLMHHQEPGADVSSDDVKASQGIVESSRLYDVVVSALSVIQSSTQLEFNPEPTGSVKRPVPPQFSVNGRRPRVLVVEDNIINQRVAVLMLQKYDCRVDTVANGKEAVSMLELLPYDLVFMDCHMPVMDGYDATRLVRTSERESGRARTPIIAITANTMQGDREKCLASGMDGHISKPIREEDLIRTLQWALPQRHSAKTISRVSLDAEDVIKRLASGDRSAAASFIELFLDECPRLVLQLGQAIESRVSADVKLKAHEIKGVMLNLGAQKAAAILKRIEDAAVAEDVKTQELLAAGLEEELKNLCATLAVAHDSRATVTDTSGKES